ncbi:hypothetical protein PVK06_004397 [Gossypium arboreum]|uniref:Reverse transcriptase n=1 Tax=Gossypium arboreum TaxID=29729 RepID=A0ABR0QSC5_GOSAR|nr:hypothetical protein PVK06_004397 [Gossypium arboreum]
MHLVRIKSDHRPLLLDLCPDDSQAKGRPFRFLAGWTQHQDFSTMISNLWEHNGDMSSTLEKFTLGLKEWNKNIYGHIGTRKREIMQKLKKIQHTLEKTNSVVLFQKEIELRKELEKVLNHEEIL